MDQTAVNSCGVNSASNLSWVLASVAITASAAVNAVAVRQYEIFASPTANAVVNVVPTNTQPGVVNVLGTGGVYPDAYLQQAATANLVASGKVQAYVLSYVAGSATIICNSTIQAIPANSLGRADITGSAAVSPTATRIQPAKANLTASGAVSNSIAPVVTRYVTANLAAAGKVRVETRINGVHETYAAPVGSANIVADPLANVMFAFNAACSANVSPVITLEQTTVSSVYANSLIVVAEPEVTRPSVAYMYPSCTVSADGTRMRLAESSFVGSSTITMAKTYQTHSANASLSGLASVSGAGTVTQYANVASAAYVNMAADASKTAYALSQGEKGTAVLEATAWLQEFGTATLTCRSLVNAEAVQTCLAYSNATNTISVVANATKTMFVDSSAQAGVTIAADATRVVMPQSVITNEVTIEAVALRTAYGIAAVDAAVTIVVDSIANPESIDPESRTFYAAPRTTEFARPYVETEFRRAA